MNHQPALLGLPVPGDCIDIINGYLFLDRTEYKNKLIKSSVCRLMRRAINVYNDEVEGYEALWDTHIFRWFDEEVQFQSKFCIQCGNYKEITNGEISKCCSCYCLI